jgi:hypothetical protein
MTSTSLKILASFALCAALTTGTALARDNDRGKAGSAWHNTVRDRDRARDFDRDRDWARDRREWRERREDRERREWRRQHPQNFMFGNNGRHNGWSQGRKTGWNNCDVPPGQAKKAGCVPVTSFRTHRVSPLHDRDHDRDRRW